MQTPNTQTNEALLQENRQLRARLEELEETLRVIRSGEVDALVVQGPQGEQVFTLKGALDPYRVMVEAMSEGAVTFSPDGFILYCNARFAELLKTPLEQMIGSSLEHFIAPHERRRFEALLAQSREAPLRKEIGVLAADGTNVPVQFSTRPLKQDTPGSIAAVVTDLSGVAAAAQARSRLALIVESSEDAIISTNLDGVVESWNAGAERLFGYTATETIGWPVQRFIATPERAGEIERNLDTVRRGEGTVHMETVRMRKDGTPIDVSVSASPIKDGTGRIVGASAILRDITERKRAEDEIRKLNAELEQRVTERTAKLEAAREDLESFAYSVSHDLRAPLRAIDGFSSRALKQCGGQMDGECQRYLNLVVDNGKKMGRLIDDILLFSRMGRVEMSAATIDMEQLARAVFDELTPGFAGRELKLGIKPLPPCHGDRALLQQVWANLLGNAIKFTLPMAAALIEVGGHADGAENVYYVRDNGAGFDMQYAVKLFGVFQRLHSDEDFEGTGIGLAIVKRIITRHGGRVWAEGKVNEGATFYFALPVERNNT